MTINELKKDFPGIYEAVKNEGREEVKAELKQSFQQGSGNPETLAKVTKAIFHDVDATKNYTNELKKRRGLK
jgi:hypothetical protein